MEHERNERNDNEQSSTYGMMNEFDDRSEAEARNEHAEDRELESNALDERNELERHEDETTLLEPLNVEGFNEEFAAEVAEPDTDFRADDRPVVREDNRLIGFLAIALAILSLFVWPLILGPAAVIAGMISYAREARGLGVAAIVIGILSFLAALLLFPYS